MFGNDSTNNLANVQRTLLIVVLALTCIILIFQFCIYFADILRILSISILLSYLFVAAVNWLNKYLKPRILAVLVVYGGILIGIAFSAFALVPTVISQVSQLINNVYDQLPRLIQTGGQYLIPVEQKLHAANMEIKTTDLINGILTFMPKLEASQVVNQMGGVAISTMTGIIYGLSILILSFYFLLDAHKMPEAIVKIFPSRYQRKIQSICSQIDTSLQAFLHGQVILALGFGMLMVIVYSILGVHYALLLGVTLAVWEIIPVIGPPIGFIPTIFAVAFDGMDNVHFNRLTQVVLVFAIFNGLQWLKDNLFAPKYIGNVIGLHPLIVFLAIMTGARIDGWLGIIIAIPAACVLQVLLKNSFHFESSAK